MTKHVRPAELGRMERKDATAAPAQDEIKTAVAKVGTAFEEFKKTNDARLAEIEKRGSADVVLVEKVEKINKELDKYEGLSARITSSEAQQKAVKEAVERVEALIGRLPAGGQQTDKDAAYKGRVNAWARGVIDAHVKGEINLMPEQKKALADVSVEWKSLGIDSDPAGGYLAPPEYVREIIKAVTEVSAPRGLVRVRTTASKSIMQPKRTGQFAAVRTLDQGTRIETTGQAYGMVEINAPELYALVDISNQNLEDSVFDLAQEIQDEAVLQFAVKEGAEFVTGTGVGQLEGIITNATNAATGAIGSTVSGSAATIADSDGQANGLLTMKTALKTSYVLNASWILNRTTLGQVRTLKDANKNYIWMFGIQSGRPNTIDGDPYTEVPDMPSAGAGNFPIGYGDWRRGYTMVDRIGMTMLRDPFTQATSGNIRFLFRRRVGGMVVLGEAMRLLKCSA